MENPCRDSSWSKKGVSFIWSTNALEKVTVPSSVVTIRKFFELATNWPDDLPSNKGNALVVAGFEGCLDSLEEEDAITWLENDFKQIMLKFQNHYEGQAALIFWLPSGRNRIQMDRATEEYYWKRGSSERLPFGKSLFAGAESDVTRIIMSEETSPDLDGSAWVGLHLARMS